MVAEATSLLIEHGAQARPLVFGREGTGLQEDDQLYPSPLETIRSELGGTETGKIVDMLQELEITKAGVA